MIKFVADFDGRPIEYALKEGINVIGRDDKCDVVIEHPQISRNHVSVIVAPEGVVIQDLNSRNGTFVNGLKVTNTAQIKHGDVVALGKYLMRCIAEEEATPEQEPPRPVTVEPPEASTDTLPFKGKYAKMMAGSSDILPAKFDPGRYQIDVHGQRIIVTDPTTNQAIELYRGTPDAAIVDKLLEDRRRRERRNLVLGVGGGLVGLILLIAVAFWALKPPTKPPVAHFDVKAYFEQLDAAVLSFNNGDNEQTVNAILDKADKAPARSANASYHIQLKNILRLKREVENDPDTKGDNWAEILKYIQMIKENPFPSNIDVGVMDHFVVQVEKQADTEKRYWDIIVMAKRARSQYNEPDALKSLRTNITDPHSIYYNTAQNMIKELVTDVINKRLQAAMHSNVTLEALKDVDVTTLTMQDLDAGVRAVNELLNAKFFRDAADKKTLEDFVKDCETFRVRQENKNNILLLAQSYITAKKYPDAWRVVQPLVTDPDPEIKRQVETIRVEYDKYVKAREEDNIYKVALAKVTDFYNRGKDKEALDIIAEQEKAELSKEDWLILKEKISNVIRYYQDAQEAEKNNDLLTAQQAYENIIATEALEANFYRRAAVRFKLKFDQMPVDDKAALYIDAARKMIAEQDFKGALRSAYTAKHLYDKETVQKQPDIDIYAEVNQIGDEMLAQAQGLHKDKQIAKGIEILKKILDKHIYAEDTTNGVSIRNAAHGLLESWQQELKEGGKN
jgi:pSer/pThr/pTyr-binding forkhead associated (FHA) protein/septum formation topological specificity factor MinE